jgi:hypothetical protein
MEREMARIICEFPPGKDQARRIEVTKQAAKDVGLKPPTVQTVKKSRLFGTVFVTVQGGRNQSVKEIANLMISAAYLLQDGARISN